MELTGSCRERVEASQRATSQVSFLRTVKLAKSSQASAVLKWKSSRPIPYCLEPLPLSMGGSRLRLPSACVLSLLERKGTLEQRGGAWKFVRQGDKMLEYVPDVFCTMRTLNRLTKKYHPESQLPTLSSFFPCSSNRMGKDGKTQKGVSEGRLRQPSSSK